MAYRYKYLIVKDRKSNPGITVAQVDVSNLNKKGIDEKWDELDAKFPNSKYISCLTQTNSVLGDFIKEPA